MYKENLCHLKTEKNEIESRLQLNQHLDNPEHFSVIKKVQKLIYEPLHEEGFRIPRISSKTKREINIENSVGKTWSIYIKKNALFNEHHVKILIQESIHSRPAFPVQVYSTKLSKIFDLFLYEIWYPKIGKKYFKDRMGKTPVIMFDKIVNKKLNKTG